MRKTAIACTALALLRLRAPPCQRAWTPPRSEPELGRDRASAARAAHATLCRALSLPARAGPDAAAAHRVSHRPQSRPRETLTNCSWCHHPSDYNRFTLLNGEKISFDEPYTLCGQCHGDKLRDWSTGIHGKQTGSWSGKKRRLTCPACHDPHRPRRPSMRAMPAPAKPGRGPGGTSHAL